MQILTAPQPKWKSLQNRRLQYWGGQVSKSNVLIPQAMPDFFESYPDLLSRIADTGAFEGSRHGRPNHCLVNEYLAGQGIMPHEDGAAYFPAVATISLGSHTLLDIYRYVDEELQQKFDAQMAKLDAEERPAATERRSSTAEGKRRWDEMDGGAIPKERIEGNVRVVRGARAREPDPVMSILQEPRSLLITTGRWYREYLHGIAERTVDGPEALKKVVNGHMIQDNRLRSAVEKAKSGSSEGTQLERDTRLSLTFRDVEKVSKGLGGLLGVVAKQT